MDLGSSTSALSRRAEVMTSCGNPGIPFQNPDGFPSPWGRCAASSVQVICSQSCKRYLAPLPTGKCGDSEGGHVAQDWCPHPIALGNPASFCISSQVDLSCIPSHKSMGLGKLFSILGLEGIGPISTAPVGESGLLGLDLMGSQARESSCCTGESQRLSWRQPVALS